MLADGSGYVFLSGLRVPFFQFSSSPSPPRNTFLITCDTSLEEGQKYHREKSLHETIDDFSNKTGEKSEGKRDHHPSTVRPLLAQHFVGPSFMALAHEK